MNHSKKIPEIVREICEDFGINGRIISCREIRREAVKRGLNQDSVLPADYCDNTITGKWQPKYNFLHSVGRGKYKLSKYK